MSSNNIDGNSNHNMRSVITLTVLTGLLGPVAAGIFIPVALPKRNSLVNYLTVAVPTAEGAVVNSGKKCCSRDDYLTCASFSWMNRPGGTQENRAIEKCCMLQAWIGVLLLD